MLVPRYPPEPCMPRILPLFWGDLRRKNPPKLQTDACLDVARRLRPCFGPRGLPKHLTFRFLHGLSEPPVIAPDTTAVLTHMSLDDPAAHALASAAISQAREVGDGAVLVLLLGASLLEQAQALLDLGLTMREVEDGYRLACGRALEVLDGGELCWSALGNPRDELEVAGFLRVLLSTRVPEMVDMLAEALLRSEMVRQCCVQSWISKEGLLTFDPVCVQVIKNITEGPPRQISEMQRCPQEDNDEDSDREKVDENTEDMSTTGQQLQEKKIEESKEKEEKSAAKEEDREEGGLADKEDYRPRRDCESDAPGLHEEAAEINERELQLIDEFLCNYIGLRPADRRPSLPSVSDSPVGPVYHEMEPDNDWEILSLAVDEIRLGGDEGADGGLGRWQEYMQEEHRARGDQQGQERRRSTTRAGGGLLRRSKAACKRLFRGLIRLGKKYLAPRSKGAEVRRQGRVRKLHRPMGKLHGPSRGPRVAREKHPVSVHEARQEPQLAKPIQANIVCQDSYEQCNQSVTITLHSTDPELLDSCEAAVRACLRLYACAQSDPRLVPGAGVAEATLSARLCAYGLSLPGLEQMAVHGFAQALQAPVRALGENRGTPADMAVIQLCEALRHLQRRRLGEGDRAGCSNLGYQQRQGEGGGVRRRDVGALEEEEEEEEGAVLEPLVCKSSALKKATTAVLSILSDHRSNGPGERGAETERAQFSPAQEPGRQHPPQPTAINR
ncbi:hypothetical protein ACEWY4_024817 [Coilia grayii]|uniref:Uncharacterized protein n=1 Tax=Coilia grayii TaxID=363190 RepID=A0ABD1IVS7_9TELE